MADEGMYSRNGAVASGGKLVESVNTPVSEELKEALIFLATACRMPLAQYVREVLESHAFGEQLRIQRMLPNKPRADDGRNLS
jgi:soluble P-type ATPase